MSHSSQIYDVSRPSSQTKVFSSIVDHVDWYTYVSTSLILYICISDVQACHINRTILWTIWHIFYIFYIYIYIHVYHTLTHILVHISHCYTLISPIINVQSPNPPCKSVCSSWELGDIVYSSPSLIKPPYVPRNCGHIREVAFGRREN